MNRWARIATALAACVLLSGCAASRSEVRKEEPPGLSVRLPIADAETLSIESDPSFPYPAYPYANPELPLSLADESRGRWLNFFEVGRTPAKPPAPPLPGGGEEP
jgi:hypothetical protein